MSGSQVTTTRMTRGSRSTRTENGLTAIPTPAPDTQVSKFFPKSSSAANEQKNVDDDHKQTTSKASQSRKRTADDVQAVGPSSGPSQAPTGSTIAAKIARNNPKAKEGLISKFFQRDDDDDDDDFAEPKKTKTAATIASKRARVTKPKAARVSKAVTKSKATSVAGKNLIRERFFSDVVAQHSSRDGVDADELQMALALSLSTNTTEAAVESEPATTSSTTKEKAVHEIFQRFGFREGFKEYNPSDFVAKPKTTSRKRPQRWLHKTTALTRRLPAVQAQKLRARLAYIDRHFAAIAPSTNQHNLSTASDCETVYQMSSEYLARFYIPQRSVHEMNATADAQPLHAFYTNNLCPVSEVSAGVLLRNWAEIPGRDVSPERQRRVEQDMAELPLSLSPEASEDSKRLLEQENVEDKQMESAIDLISDSGSSGTNANSKSELLAAAPETETIIKPTVVSALTSTSSSTSVYFTPQKSKNRVSLPRSVSPDMFASTDSESEDEPDNVESAPPAKITQKTRQPSSSSDPPCSLDPESSSRESLASSQLPDEEDRLIEMYHKAAEQRNQSSPRKEQVMESESGASQTTTILDSDDQIFYSGVSELGDSTDSQNRTLQPEVSVVSSSTGAVLKQLSSVSLTMNISPKVSDLGDEDDGFVLDEVHGDGDVPRLDGSQRTGTFTQSIGRSGITVIEHFDVSDEAKISDVKQPTDAFNIVSSPSPAAIELSDNSEPMDNAPISQSPTPNAEKSTDDIDFSFDSIASQVETTISLRKQVLQKSIAVQGKYLAKQPVTESIEISDDELSCTNAENIKGNESLEALVKCLNQPSAAGDSIEISDDDDGDKGVPANTDELSTAPHRQDAMMNFSFPSRDELEKAFEFTMQLTRKPSLEDIDNDDAPIVFDDEINYSMSNESLLPINRRRRKSILPQPTMTSITNESLQHIFIEDDDEPLAEDDLLNQSVASIVRQEFLSNSRDSFDPVSIQRQSSVADKRQSGAGNFRRYKSDVSRLSLAKQSNPSEAARTIVKHGDLDETDEFDRMVLQSNIHLITKPQLKTKPSTSVPRTPTKSPPNAANDLQFTIQHDGLTYDVKCGARSVTPKPDFERMDSPTRAAQLRRFGLKPLLSRRKAIICLEHIYNRTHPFVECSSEATGQLSAEDFVASADRIVAAAALSPPAKVQPVARSVTPKKPRAVTLEDAEVFYSNAVSNPSRESLPHDYFVYFLNHQADYILPSAPRAKRPWCLLPLHIAWYNLLHDNPRLFEQVLQYQPVELREIRAHFKQLGALYDANDMIAFFDRHCITFRAETGRPVKATKKDAPK